MSCCIRIYSSVANPDRRFFGRMFVGWRGCSPTLNFISLELLWFRLYADQSAVRTQNTFDYTYIYYMLIWPIITLRLTHAYFLTIYC